MNEADAVENFVAAKLRWLSKRDEKGLLSGDKKAALARLRRSVGKEAVSVPEIWQYVYEDIPDILAGDASKALYAQSAVHIALTLYAMHSQGHTKNGADIDKAKAKKALSQKEHSAEIALFGRMVADDPALNADASAQVAHSISVHKVDNEYDFYTAVDDVKARSEEAEDAGAGMLGTIEFNSSTLYRYATVFVNLLYDELANDADVTAKAVSEFARGFITSMPTGKQNTFANRTPAHAVLVTIREDQPVNLIGAFEKPIGFSDKNEGFARPATKRLGKYASDVYASFAEPPVKSYILMLSDVADEFINQKNQDGSPCKKVNLNQLLEI
ncbi:MAG: type I-E CRISPR-associated protein Cas7/Cse4/CasC [Gracilibacteraceae bacterium]|jgi:CRISPR system Cascade subunit CasC|nr:type I-E CRISPR-associated protein Cas7/Cse4/CasC [Gracilibacteraceae bacterium]